MFSRLCPPALIYLIFCIIQIGIDVMKGYNNTALIKVWVTFVFTILLNYLCQSGLGIISWIIVFVPFILMTVIVAMLLMLFGLDPRSGKLKVYKTDKDKPLNNNPQNEIKLNKEDRYGSDKPDESTTEYDKLNIQQKSQTRTKKDTAYGMYTDFHSTNDTLEYVDNSVKTSIPFASEIKNEIIPFCKNTSTLPFSFSASNSLLARKPGIL